MRHKKNSLCLILFSCFIFMLIPLFLYSGETFVIKAKKLYTVSDGVLENGMVFVENGKIVRVGKNLPVPKKAKLLQSEVVIPGLIDIHSHLGTWIDNDTNEETELLTPQVRALDSFYFDDPGIQSSLAGGVTTIVIRPGSAEIIGGASFALKLKNAPPEQMVLKEICDLKMALLTTPAGMHDISLMNVYFLAKKAFLEAQEYMKNWEKYKKDTDEKMDVKSPERDLRKEILVMALKKEIPVHIHCHTPCEIMSCIRLADEFNLKLSLGHCTFAYLIVNELAKRKDIYFNCGPLNFSSYTGDSRNFKCNPAILANAGLKVSLQTDGGGWPKDDFRYLGAGCYRYGMQEEDVLKALTLYGAEAVNLDKRIGTIEKGKDADLVFLDGEPFEITTSVERVMVDGKIEYETLKSASQNRFVASTPDASGKLTFPPDLKKAGAFAIKAGTVFTMAGQPIKNGIVLINGGKIEKVGKNLCIPEDYTILDAQEFTLMPGSVHPRVYRGVNPGIRYRHIEEPSNPIVPELEAKYAVEPQAQEFSRFRQLGITTALVTPGDTNVIGGQCVALKTTGAIIDKMIVKDKAAMIFALGPTAKRNNQMPSTRMGIAALLRETLIKAREYMDKAKKLEKSEEKSARNYSFEALLPVLNREMPVIIHCERMDDILTALRITDEFGLRTIIEGGEESYKVVKEIKQRNVPVILDNIFEGQKDGEYHSNENPVILSKAGIKVAFETLQGVWTVQEAALGVPGTDPFLTAAYAVKNGMSEEAALKAITIDAAKIIGVGDRVGSLEPGKDADILIMRGHPLKTKSILEAVFIDGKLVYKRDDLEPTKNDLE